MPRALSNAARTAMFNQEGGAAVFLVVLTISHPSMSPIRVVNDMVSIVHLGNTYQAAAFGITLPAEVDERPPQVRLRIDNVDRSIVLGVRLLDSPATVTMTVILAATPNTIEAGPFVFVLRDTDYDALTVTGTLSYEDILNETYPKDRFTPIVWPGMFRDVSV
jgi:hypothetical protein